MLYFLDCVCDELDVKQQRRELRNAAIDSSINTDHSSKQRQSIDSSINTDHSQDEAEELLPMEHFGLDENSALVSDCLNIEQRRPVTCSQSASRDKLPNHVNAIIYPAECVPSTHA